MRLATAIETAEKTVDVTEHSFRRPEIYTSLDAMSLLCCWLALVLRCLLWLHDMASRSTRSIRSAFVVVGLKLYASASFRLATLSIPRNTPTPSTPNTALANVRTSSAPICLLDERFFISTFARCIEVWLVMFIEVISIEGRYILVPLASVCLPLLYAINPRAG